MNFSECEKTQNGLEKPLVSCDMWQHSRDRHADFAKTIPRCRFFNVVQNNILFKKTINKSKSEINVYSLPVGAKDRDRSSVPNVLLERAIE